MHSITVCIYSLADLNISHCVQLTFLEFKLGRFLILTILNEVFLNLLHFESESRFNSDENCFQFITGFLDFTTKNPPACPQKGSTRHSDLCLNLLEIIYMLTCAFFKKILHYTVHIFINKFIFKHISAKNLHRLQKETTFNKSERFEGVYWKH